MKFVFAAFTTLMLAMSAAQAQSTYTIDPVHTQVIFFVDHLGFTKSAGKFHVKEGTFSFDEKDWSKAQVNVTIDATSLDMGDQKWDTHMKSKDFFNVEQFPTIDFRSTRVEPKSANNFIVHGDLTMLGVTKPAALDVKVNKVGTNPMSKKPHAGFSATTHVKRSDYGMRYGLPAIGDEAEIRLEVEGGAATGS